MIGNVLGNNTAVVESIGWKKRVRKYMKKGV